MEAPMRYAVDVAILGVVFVLAMMLFQNAVSAALAGMILAGAADAVLWDPKKN